MKKTIFIIVAALLLVIALPVKSQGLYTPEQTEDPTQNTSTGFFQQNSPMLTDGDGFGGEGGPGAPGTSETPVGDALWVVLLLSGIYIVINRKYQFKGK